MYTACWREVKHVKSRINLFIEAKQVKGKFSLFINEVKLMMYSKMLWAIILITDIFMVVGINSINLSNLMSLHNIKRTSLTIALGSAKYGAMAGTFLFSLFTILILSKEHIKKSKVVIEACIDYDSLIKMRIFAVFFYEVITAFIGMLLVILVQIFSYNVSLDFSAYIWSYVSITLPALFFAVLISSGLYMLMESIDISILIVVILFIFNLVTEKYLFQWIDLGDIVFSDFAGIRPVGKLIIYNRVLWCFISILVFCTGLLTRRRYGFNFIKSILTNKKNKVLSIVLVIIVFLTSSIYNANPYTMKSNFVEAEPVVLSSTKLKKVKPEIYFDNKKETMQAKVMYEFDGNKSDSIQFATNEGLKVQAIKVNGESCSYEKIAASNKIKVPVPNKEGVNVEVSYAGSIKYDKNSQIAGYICSDSIYLLEVSNFIFRPLTETEKMIDISGFYSAPQNLTMVTPGKLINVENKGANKQWNFKFQAQSLDLGAFAAEYKKEEFQVNGSKIEFYYSPKHEEYIKQHDMVKLLKDMFSYYSDNIGEFYTKEYPLKIVETSIYKPGGHSSGNVISFGEYMVNREKAIDISDTYEANLPHDLGIIAHEMAHQWWGTGVQFDEDRAWSSEGFAQYLAYKYLQKEVGKDAAEGEFLRLWENEVRKLKNSYYLNDPKNLEKLNNEFKYRKLMEKLQNLRYYYFPLSLSKAEEEQGEEVFIKHLSAVYKQHKNKKLTYEEFLKEMSLSEEVLPIE